MGLVSGDDAFLVLCQEYAELAAARAEAVRRPADDPSGEPDQALAEELEDLDARQRILMWRIIRAAEQRPRPPVGARRERSIPRERPGGALIGQIASLWRGERIGAKSGRG